MSFFNALLAPTPLMIVSATETPRGATMTLTIKKHEIDLSILDTAWPEGDG